MLGLVLLISIIIDLIYNPQSALTVGLVALLALSAFLLAGWGDDIPTWILYILGRNPPGEDNLDSYESIIKTVETESEEAARQLRLIDLETNEDTFTVLAGILKRGRKAEGGNPIERTVAIIERRMKTKEYVDEAEALAMNVVDVREDKIVVRTTNTDNIPEYGLLFNLSIQTVTQHEGESITDRENVAVAEFIEQRGDEILIMEIVDVKEDTVGSEKELLNTLMRKAPEVKVRTEGEEQIKWEDMEQVYEYLQNTKETVSNHGHRR